MEQEIHKLRTDWSQAWPEALALWSPYTRLSEPRWACNPREAVELGINDSFASIRVRDHAVFIALHQVVEYGLEDYAVEILAHEIGHHVLCPGNLQEAGQSIALAARALPTCEHYAGTVVNMWEDLLINDRLVRYHRQRHAEVYEKLNANLNGEPSKIWGLYMRAFEYLWGLERGRLCQVALQPNEEGDAYLVSRMVRVYGEDWMAGVGGFAALCLPYIMGTTTDLEKRLKILYDTQGMGEGCEVPLGILDGGEWEIVHPTRDPRVMGSRAGGDEPGAETGQASSDSDRDGSSQEIGGGEGQRREPHLFGQVLKALGIKLDQHDAAVKFYREKALPHLIPFPTQESEPSVEPLMEGLEPWDVGFPMEQVDWLQSVMLSPTVVPGMTTVQRTWGVMGGSDKERIPLDLDLYVDCSGSIPNPQQVFSFLALAGAIVVLSALRAGARVQATLWSGAGEYDKTAGFISDENALLRVLTGYLGGGTAFPNHIVRETYSPRRETDRPVHILILSDEGIDTMAMNDEQGTPGLEISRMGLEKARGGGTMVLNLYYEGFLDMPFCQEVKKMGWEIFRIEDWSGLLAFARDFAKRKYGATPR